MKASTTLLLATLVVSASAGPLMGRSQEGSSTLEIPLQKRGAPSLTQEDGSVDFTRFQSHLAHITAKYVQGVNNHVSNTGNILILSPSMGVEDIGGMDATLGRRAWGAPEGGSLEWGQGAMERRALSPLFPLAKRNETVVEETKRSVPERIFAGFRGAGMVGARLNALRDDLRTKSSQSGGRSGVTRTPISNQKGATSPAAAAAASATTSSSSYVEQVTSSSEQAITSSSTSTSSSTYTPTSTSIAPAATSVAPVAAAGSGGESLTNYNGDMLWAGSVSIGTPARDFILDFDTGSADLWIPSSSCTSSACASHTKYDPSQSSSSAFQSSKSFSITYGDGSSTSGAVYAETVAVAGVTATGQSIGAATTLSASFADDPMDGLCGMGYQSISQLKSSPLFQTMVSQGAVSTAQFSFKLASSGSQLFLGGMNSAHYVAGSTQWAPVTSQSYWVVQGAANVNGGQVASFSAIIDSGTSVIVAPSAAAQSFWSSVPNSAVYGSGYYTFPCATPPTISFSFGGSGKQWNIAAKDLNLGRVSSGSARCVGAIVGADVGVSGWILGDTFMKNTYTTFDLANNMVGFSTLA